MSRKTIILTVLMLLAGLPSTSVAHESGTVQLELSIPAETLRSEVDLVDLDYVLDLDADEDNVLTASDVERHRAEIAAYIAGTIALGGCDLVPADARVGLRRDTSVSVVVDLPLDCRTGPSSVSSSLFSTLPDYRTMLLVDSASSSRTFLLGDAALQLDATAGEGFSTFFAEGVHHILIGIDHIAFLLVLVLPLALRGSWTERIRSTALIVTAFTIAHSITLTLSTLGHISLPSRPVELVIAASVVLAALFNMLRPRHLPGWMLAYTFGLIHGFGFAGALADLSISEGLGIGQLLAFNLGVEAGQLLVISVALPLLYSLGRFRAMRYRLVPAGSAAIALLGVFWIVERF